MINIIKKHFALLITVCVVASYSNSGNLERRGAHSYYYKELHCLDNVL